LGLIRRGLQTASPPLALSADGNHSTTAEKAPLASTFTRKFNIMTFDELFAEHNLTPNERKDLVIHLVTLRARKLIEALLPTIEGNPT
jgi:hypothetical protein